MGFDKERVVLSLAKGGTASGYPQTGFDLLQAYGYDVLSDYLKLEHDLMARFVDYEEMDDYPELSSAIDIYADDACITYDTEIPLLNGSVETVGSLYERGATKEWIYAFDVAKKRVVAGQFDRVAVIAESLPVYKVTFRDRDGNIGYIKTTADHEFLMLNGQYQPTSALKAGDRLMALFKFSYRNKNRKQSYEQVLVEPFARRWKSTHRMVLESIGCHIPDGHVVHHKDHCGLNNSPGNLGIMSLEEHISQHRRFGADNPRFRSDVTADDLMGVVAEGYLSKKAAGDRLGCSYRVIDRLVGELGYENWTELKEEKFGLNRRSRGHESSPETLERYDRVVLALVRTIEDDPEVTFFGACDRLAVSPGVAEAAIAKTGRKSWSHLKVESGGVLAPGRFSNVVQQDSILNDVVISVEPAGEERIFDLVNSVPTHNFAAGHDGRYVFIKNTQVESMKNQTVWVDSPDKTVELILNDLFHRRLRIDEEIWSMARTLVKYGNGYEEMLVAEDGVVGTNFLPPPTMRRIEGRRGELYGFVQDRKGRFGYSPQEFKQLLTQRLSGSNMAQQKFAALEDWEVVHMRLRSKQRRSMYGNSVLESARWIWKRLMLLEDAAIVYRLQRAPQRYAFYVDVGTLPPKEAFAYLHKIRQQYKKTKFYNPQTGKLDLKFNPLPVSHDTVIPLLDGRSIDIKTMAEEHAAGVKHWVYSIDRETGSSVPGEVSWVGKTRSNARALRVTFDDGRHAVMAPDHPVMLRSGRYVNAEGLKPGMSVMPLYRRLSSKKGGDSMEGYDMWYDPGEKVYRYTHRVVDACLGIKGDGELIHHRDFDKRNNLPSNLQGMTYEDHRNLHKAAGHSGGKAVARMRKVDPELDRRLRDASSRNITKYNRSAEKRSRTSELNRLNDTAKHIRVYNASDQHKYDNEIRRAGKKEFWADSERAERARERMKLTFPDEFIDGVRALIRENPAIGANGVVSSVNGCTALLSGLDGANRRTVKSVHRHMLLNMYRRLGHESFAAFRDATLNDPPDNHRVVLVEEVESCDMYCMTVERWHNFALSLKDDEGNASYRSGVFVKNSQDEDFFVPMREGKATSKIDVVGSPAWQHMEDIEYFKLKMYSAIKVPKVYLGSEAPRAKGVLSQEDVRFARTVLRIQRELRNGLKKIARVHLASLNINPAAVDYEIYMTVPSSIFELAQLEVRNARADFAQRMSQFVSLHWILQKVFGLSDSEIEYIIKERHEEQLADAEVQAKAMGLQMDVQGQAQIQQQAAVAKIQTQQAVDQARALPAEGSPAKPAKPKKKNEDARQYLRTAGSLSRMWPQLRQMSGYKPITEQELFAGNRDHEKFVEDNLDKILEGNSSLAHRLNELGQLIKELRFHHRG